MIRMSAAASAIAVLFVFAVASSAGAKPRPSIKVSPGALSIGDTATVTGRGFKPRTQFVLKVNEARFAVGTTNRKGRLRMSFTIPTGAWQELNLKVTCAGKSATATIVVRDGEANVSDSEGISDDLQEDTSGNPLEPGQVPEFNF